MLQISQTETYKSSALLYRICLREGCNMEMIRYFTTKFSHNVGYAGWSAVLSIWTDLAHSDRIR